MESSKFLLDDYLNKNADMDIKDLRSKLYSEGVLSKDYKEDGLILLYNRYDNKNKNDLEKECRSVILNRNNLEIVSYSCNTPITNMEALNYMLKESNNIKKFYECYEGTLLSLFYFNDKWYLSTRRCLNSKNSKWKERTHYDMFCDVLNLDNNDFDSFTEKLDKEQCYYFILVHFNNRNIVDYSSRFGEGYTKLVLAFVRNKDQVEVDLSTLKLDFLSNNIILSEEYENLDFFDKKNGNYSIEEDPNSEGVIVKSLVDGNYKYLKLQYMNYQFHNAMGSEKNLLMGFIHLYQKNKLVNYFENNDNFFKFKKIINPINTNESYDTVGVVDAVFKVLTSELFLLYKLFWNFKTGQHQNENLYKMLPKIYKDLLFGIKGMYFKMKANAKGLVFLRIKNIYDYLKTLDSNSIERLLMNRKLMFNWVKNENSDELKLFNKISDRCDKVHLKLIAIFTSKLFPEIMPDDIPKK